MGPLRHSLVTCALAAAAVAGAPAGAALAAVPRAAFHAVVPAGVEGPPAGAEAAAVAGAVAAAEPGAARVTLAAAPPGRELAAAGAPQAEPVALAATPPAAVAPASAATAAPAGAPPDGARTIRISLPLELEVHGRFLMGVSADGRDAWGRTLGVSSARLGLEARIGRVKTVIEADLASDPLVEDAYVRLEGPAATRLTAGRFKSPFSERRLESSWRLPLVERGLVDRYLVKRNGLGGRRVGIAGTVTPWGGRLGATGGVFLGDPDALEAGSDAGEDWAARVAARAWDALEVGVSGYRAGRGTGPGAAPLRYAASAFATGDLGPLQATLEGFTGSVVEGPFLAGTALVAWKLRAGEGRRLRLTPVVGAEALELRGAVRGVGYGATAGAVISWTEGLKVKLQGEWARRPGDPAPAGSVAAEVGTRF